MYSSLCSKVQKLFILFCTHLCAAKYKNYLFYFVLWGTKIIYFILFYFILFYFILFYFILFYFILFYFIFILYSSLCSKVQKIFIFILFYFILFFFFCSSKYKKNKTKNYLFYFILFYFFVLWSTKKWSEIKINFVLWSTKLIWHYFSFQTEMGSFLCSTEISTIKKISFILYSEVQKWSEIIYLFQTEMYSSLGRKVQKWSEIIYLFQTEMYSSLGRKVQKNIFINFCTLKYKKYFY